MSKRTKSVHHETDQAHTTGTRTTDTPSHEAIARLAYELWLQRGGPVGSPEEDWSKAEAQLQQSVTAVKVRTANG
jgi:hypothetical protein